MPASDTCTPRPRPVTNPAVAATADVAGGSAVVGTVACTVSAVDADAAAGAAGGGAATIAAGPLPPVPVTGCGMPSESAISRCARASAAADTVTAVPRPVANPPAVGAGRTAVGGAATPTAGRSTAGTTATGTEGAASGLSGGGAPLACTAGADSASSARAWSIAAADTATVRPRPVGQPPTRPHVVAKRGSGAACNRPARRSPFLHAPARRAAGVRRICAAVQQPVHGSIFRLGHAHDHRALLEELD